MKCRICKKPYETPRMAKTCARVDTEAPRFTAYLYVWLYGNREETWERELEREIGRR